jgi:hypothetical protein
MKVKKTMKMIIVFILLLIPILFFGHFCSVALGVPDIYSYLEDNGHKPELEIFDNRLYSYYIMAKIEYEDYTELKKKFNLRPISLDKEKKVIETMIIDRPISKEFNSWPKEIFFTDFNYGTKEYTLSNYIDGNLYIIGQVFKAF